MTMEPVESTTVRQINVQTLEHRIESLDSKLDAMALQMATQLATISGQITSRSEIAAEDNKRVSVERFDGEMSGMRDRLGRLENGPQKMLAWLAMGAGCLSVVVTAAGVLVAVAVAIIPHLR